MASSPLRLFPRAASSESLFGSPRSLFSFSPSFFLFYFPEDFRQRVQRLEEFSRRLAAGDFAPVELEDRNDELTALARAMNETAARLAQSFASLTDERNRTAAILESMIEGVAVISSEERAIFYNRAFAQILDLEPRGATVQAPMGTMGNGRPLVETVRQSELLTAVHQVLASGQREEIEVTVGTLRPGLSRPQ